MHLGKRVGAYAPKAKNFGDIRPAIEGALIGSD